MDNVKTELCTGVEAREIDPEGVQWPPDSTVLYARENGEIVGRVGIIELPHIEGTWIAESKRGSSLAPRLIAQMEKVVARLGRSHIFAFAEDSKPEIADYMERFGYTKFPVTVWAKSLNQPTEKELDWIQRGMDFHDRLFALRPSDTHVDDVQHFQDVGHCLEIAFDENNPERAMEFYAQRIADGAPYEPIRLVSVAPDSVTVDMGTHGVIEISRDGAVREVTCQ